MFYEKKWKCKNEQLWSQNTFPSKIIFISKQDVFDEGKEFGESLQEQFINLLGMLSGWAAKTTLSLKCDSTYTRAIISSAFYTLFCLNISWH
jgi:hypothetical protein